MLFRSEGKMDLLELGAGQGRDTLYFARQGLRVHALDYVQVAVDEVLARARAAGLADSVSASCHDVREPLPFADESFDACYSHMLFCMALTTPELERLAAEVRRVLRPGGLHVYTVRTTADAHYGIGIARGDDMYEVGGFIVHFFSRTLVGRLAAGYELLEVVEFEEGALPRRLCRVTMRKADGRGSGQGELAAAPLFWTAGETPHPGPDVSGINEVIADVRRELDQVRQVKKCRGCECLLDVLESIQGDLSTVGTPEAKATREELGAWFEMGNAKRHRCLDCEVCLPIEPYNRFSAFLRDADSPRPAPGVSVAPDASPEVPALACGCGDT